MSDQMELYPCRFCGNINPNYYPDWKIHCQSCDHEITSFWDSSHNLHGAKELWQARNEKHNPFRENK